MQHNLDVCFLYIMWNGDPALARKRILLDAPSAMRALLRGDMDGRRLLPAASVHALRNDQEVIYPLTYPSAGTNTSLPRCSYTRSLPSWHVRLVRPTTPCTPAPQVAKFSKHRHRLPAANNIRRWPVCKHRYLTASAVHLQHSLDRS
jgi:hypothetical protein